MNGSEIGKYGKMGVDDRYEIPLRKGLIKFPENKNDPPRLIASECVSCGDISFPSKILCGKCNSIILREYLLSSTAEIHTYTVIYQGGLPGVQTPNILVVVKFPDDEELLVAGQMVDADPEDIKIGLKVETIVDVVRAGLLGLLSGKPKNVVGYKFRLVNN